jgi:hypothetical protein
MRSRSYSTWTLPYWTSHFWLAHQPLGSSLQPAVLLRWFRHPRFPLGTGIPRLARLRSYHHGRRSLVTLTGSQRHPCVDSLTLVVTVRSTCIRHAGPTLSPGPTVLFTDRQAGSGAPAQTRTGAACCRRRTLVHVRRFRGEISSETLERRTLDLLASRTSSTSRQRKNLTIGR